VFLSLWNAKLSLTERFNALAWSVTCLGTFANNPVAEVVAAAQILAEVRKFTYPDDDKTERDRDEIEYRGTTVYFHIDAYDADLKWGSPDPRTPALRAAS